MREEQKDDTLVRTVNGEAEALMVKTFLRAHDIPCDFRGESMRTVGAFTVDGLGTVEIHCPGELADRARELLDQADAGELTLDSSAPTKAD